MWFIGVEVEQETSAPPPKKILDPPCYILLFQLIYLQGKCAAIFGPTLIELACHTSTKLENMSYVFTSRSVGYLVGSIIGGWLYDKYNGHGVLALSCVWSTVMMIVLPYATSLVGLLIVSALLGIGLGAIDTCKQNLS